MPEIYVVSGVTGEYSDRKEWLARAFHTEPEAQQFADACSAEANKLFAAVNMYAYASLYNKHTLDPKCQWDYTGTTYYVSSCPFGGEP